ncbi:MAG: DUF4433 domain-containing protein [Roseiflexaceae bacterium]|nr:DUF4433 domain-containing protein [Roseiflexaceae bacterium]
MADLIDLYHITHVRNLPAIIARGALCCHTIADRDQLTSVTIGYRDLKHRRSMRHVPVGPGGVLSDYVPWYFGPRAPMLYVINKGNVAGYNEGQHPVIRLVTSVERVRDAGLAFVFTDGHAVVQFSEFYTDLSQINHVDMPLMQERYWNDTAADNDRERRRNAEFLVHGELPWSLIGAIGVLNQDVADQVSAALPSGTTEPRVLVRPQWYY